LDHPGDVPDLLEEIALAFLLEEVLELGCQVEMILDRALAASRDEDDLREPGVDRLLHHVLDRRDVDDRQHLLRNGLGGGQEARAEPRGRDDRLPRSHEVRSLRSCASWSDLQSMQSVVTGRALSRAMPMSEAHS